MNDVAYVVAIISVRGGGSTVALVRQNIVEVVCVHAEATKLLIYPREAQKYFDGNMLACKAHPEKFSTSVISSDGFSGTIQQSLVWQLPGLPVCSDIQSC